MKKYILSAIAIATTLLVGCNKSETEVPAVQGNVVKVTANLGVSKVSTNADNTKYQWEAGDVIGVWTGAEFTPFTVEASSVGTGVGVFTGTVPDGGAVTETSVAVYPYCADDTLEGTSYTTNYNSSNWSYLSAVPMLAKAGASVNGSAVADFKFGLLTAAAKLTIKNIPAEAKLIFLEAPQKILFGTGTADISAEFPKVSTGMSNYDYAFVELPEHSSAIEEYTFFIPIVCGEYTDPTLRFTFFSCDMDNFTWAQAADNGGIGEMDKSVYNHRGNLNTGGYINRGDLFVLPVVEF